MAHEDGKCARNCAWNGGIGPAAFPPHRVETVIENDRRDPQGKDFKADLVEEEEAEEYGPADKGQDGARGHASAGKRALGGARHFGVDVTFLVLIEGRGAGRKEEDAEE